MGRRYRPGGRYALPRAYLLRKYGTLSIFCEAIRMKSAQIIIKDLKFYGFHGVYPEEQVVGTTFRADIILDIDPESPGFDNDRLNDTLNYERIVERALEVATKQKFKLIERLAQVLCEEMLKFERVLCADVTIYKSVNRLTPEPQWIGVRRTVRRS